MAEYVLEAGLTTPNKTALKVLSPNGCEIWSFAQLRSAILGLATELRALGLMPDDRILMRLGNEVAFPIAYLGCIAADLVPIPTSAQLTTNDIDKICTELSPKAILHSQGAIMPSQQDIPRFDNAWQKKAYSAPPFDPVKGNPDRLAYIVYTSGTGGTPRAVGHAHRAVWARRMMWTDWYNLHTTDRLLHAGTFNWTYTLGTGLIDPWSKGATALVCSDAVDPTTLPDLMAQHDVTLFAAAPAVYRRVLRTDAPWDVPKLRHGLSAGEKLPPKLRHAWKAATETPMVEAYGMTECSTFISAHPSDPTKNRPQKGRRVAIVDENGDPIPRGETGTIAIDGTDPGFMIGYLNAPQEQANKLRNGWFLTGDQGAMSDDDTVTFVGRADDMMNAGGIRVSPIEVETAMTTHEGVTECAAVAFRVKEDVEVIALFYTGSATENDLRSHAEITLAVYKRPRLYIAKDVLPKGANNKLLRGALRQLGKGA